ncbi:MAG: exosortase system-associated protein, TIGR04073 family [Verrucomicrobiae bacterium]|nr:exosortase system-associated protein, TIGR04073 family [Verrucomicrobiae bacterium]MCB1086745.1 exosortase system-associated protein, TIGR04073 family [Verrucomicrobiae bacterium]
MKKFLVAIALLGLVTAAVADIQSPPKAKYTSTRKLARGLSNILYGWTELPTTVWRSYESGDQSTEIIFNGIISGLDRTGQRIAYGFYEVVNFRKPLYKNTFRPPYPRLNYDPTNGFEEFPPQVGQLSTVSYTRGLSY